MSVVLFFLVALEEIQHANKQKQEAPSANTYRSIDNYEPNDGEPITGRQSRSFRMLQQMTAEEEAMMEEL